ncbi:hypothetical protein [Streptomyces sp. NPDC054952]
MATQPKDGKILALATPQTAPPGGARIHSIPKEDLSSMSKADLYGEAAASLPGART